jgi:threonylcarbamoyladenosine tRNA methylthiotransferase MtaB
MRRRKLVVLPQMEAIPAMDEIHNRAAAQKRDAVLNKTVAFHTLGCKLNYSETSTLSRLLEKEGFGKATFEEHADVYVINTCSVTENADRECRHLVRQVRRRAPESLVVITGCYAQLKPEAIAAIPGVDLVLGAAEKFNIVEHLKELSKGDAVKVCSCDIGEVKDFNASWSLNDRTRTFLKVQDGCDYNCSFCTIPLARGRSRSGTIAATVANVRRLAAEGRTKEIVLTGVNLGDFGNAGDEDLFGLMRQLDLIEGIDRYRISSIEPNLLGPEMIEWVAGSRKFMPHFHIPLQSGSDRILGLMRRRYKKELYARRVKGIRNLMPHCAIGVDVIAGFPGESEEDFQETLDFLQEADISYLHVFTYSERDQTKALEIRPVVPISLRNERNRRLRSLSWEKMQHFTARHAGQTRPVLFEGHVTGEFMEGYTDNYIKITTPYRPEWVNQIVDWRL